MNSSLSDCIKLDQESFVEGDVTLCYGVSFVLDQALLIQLLQAKSGHEALVLADDVLIAWRRYALFHENNDLQYAWSFALQYEGQGVLQTLITRDGEILHQVCEEILPDASLYRQLSEIHTWLMQQLMGQLHWRIRGSWIGRFAWIAAIAIVFITVLLNLGKFTAQPLLIIPMLLSLLLLQWGIKKLTRFALPNINHFLLRQMMCGFFAKKYHRRQFALRYLANL